MRTGSEADAAHALTARKIAIDSNDIDYCHGIFSVAAIVDGHAVRLTVDTGASASDLTSLSNAGEALTRHSARSRTEAEPASGPVAKRVAKGARIQVGELSVRKDINILVGAPEVECPTDGVLGVDVLRSCVLVFGPTKGMLRMQCDGERAAATQPHR